MGSPEASAKPFTYSPEQTAIFDTRNSSGSYIVIANAGSGKTESSAELVVLAYIEIEKRLFPQAKAHVSGDDQIRILMQILVVTFTKKAAAELDARIKRKFHQRGIPSPTRFGKPFIICRTLDSFLQMWVSKPAFFGAWRQFDPDWEQCLSRIHASLRPEAQAILKEGTGAPLYPLFLKWDRLLIGDRQEALADLVVRMEYGLDPLPGYSWDELRARFDRFKASITAEESSWKAGFMDEFAAAYRAHESAMQALLQRRRAGVGRGTAQVVPLSQAEEEKLEAWRKHADIRADFLSIYELARSRGYDPVRDVAPLAKLDVILAICASRHFEHIKPIHSMAHAFYRMKRVLGMMDFGDYIQAFTQVTGSKEGRWLLETDKEFPAMGFRRKVVIWDEVQDNNPLQFRILRNFVTRENQDTGAQAPYLSVAVGDPFQSLYEFRGASPFQFINAIERLRTSNPKALLGLTCSFRSAQGIVRLGNSIISRLSNFAENAKPSRTVYAEEGTITLAPPLHRQEEEADWVMQHIAALRQKEGGSFMVVMRSGVDSHPISARLRLEGAKDVHLMTIHASKGLEADHVFVLGLTSGKFPDVRGSMEQEVNAFYVACTRPRRNLFLCAPMVTIREDEDGTAQEELVGPSIFILAVPELKKLALSSGKWTEANLRMGQETHAKGVAQFIGSVEKKKPALLIEAKTYAEGVDNTAELRATKYLGADSPHVAVPVAARPLPPPDASEDDSMRVSEAQATSVMGKLRKGFFKNGRVAPLTPQEKSAAAKLGLISINDAGKVDFTRSFMTKLRS